MFEINDSVNATNILNDDALRFFEKFLWHKIFTSKRANEEKYS